MRICSIDIETCGLNPETCDILEFGAILDNLNEQPRVDIDFLPFFQCYFIKESYTGQPTALSMHPNIFKKIATREKGFNYVSPMKFGNMFKKFLIDNGYETKNDRVAINVAGKNFGSFDLQFLKKQTDIEKHVEIRSRILDPSILYMTKEDDSLPGLSKCKLRAGFHETVSHCAIDDARDVLLLLRAKINFNPIPF